MMATMLDHDHALRAMITPVSIMVSVTMHFDTHTAAVTIAISMYLASVTVTVSECRQRASLFALALNQGRSSKICKSWTPTVFRGDCE
jgi:hypothetical protein